MIKTRMSALLWALLPLAAMAQVQPELELRDAWVRALPPTQPNTAAYLAIRNPGPEALKITAATAELAERVEIHTTREVDGYMRMQQLQHLDLPAGGEVALAPGGTHLMLLGLARMPAVGETVELCLVLASGAQACTRAEVRREGVSGQSHQHHH